VKCPAIPRRGRVFAIVAKDDRIEGRELIVGRPTRHYSPGLATTLLDDRRVIVAHEQSDIDDTELVIAYQFEKTVHPDVGRCFKEWEGLHYSRQLAIALDDLIEQVDLEVRYKLPRALQIVVDRQYRVRHPAPDEGVQASRGQNVLQTPPSDQEADPARAISDVNAGRRHATSVPPLSKVSDMRQRSRADQAELLLDPSVLLAPRSFKLLSQLVRGEWTDNLFVPATFRAVVLETPIDSLLWRYFGPQPGPRSSGGRRRGWESSLRQPIPTRDAIASWLERSAVSVYSPTRDEIAAARSAQTLEVAEALAGAYPFPVGQILLEEWLFLQSRSWFASRRKWVFGRFVWAGGVAIDVGRRGYDAALARARSELPQLMTRRGAKGIARWVARSGSTAAATALIALGGLWEAAITKTVAASVDVVSKRLFLLFDP
jgi:hypothetical protein